MTGVGARARATLLGSAALLLVTGLPSAAMASVDANWSSGLEAGLPGGAGVNSVNSVSCASAGNCSAVGSYFDNLGDQPGLLLSETDGVWVGGTAAQLAVGAGEVSIESVSCASAADCSAVGYYFDSAGNVVGALLNEAGGAWGEAVAAKLPADGDLSPEIVEPSSVACASAGNCAAVGRYLDTSDHWQGLLLSETGGVWAAGVRAPLPPDANPVDPSVSLNSVSCASPGKCVAVGDYVDSSGHTQGLLLSATSDVWAAKKAALPAGADTDPGADLSAVSCVSVGDCTAIGDYSGSGRQGLLLTEAGGVWASGIKAGMPVGARPDPGVSLNSVSCPAAGDCGAVGEYVDSAGHTQGLLLSQTGGAWATGVEAVLPADSGSDPSVALPSVSCPAAGECDAVGQYVDSSGLTQALLLSQTGGAWASGDAATLPADASLPPVSSLDSISCSSLGECSAVGSYQGPGALMQGLLLNAVPASPGLSVSIPAGGTAGSSIPGASVSASLTGGLGPVGTVGFRIFGPQSSPPTSCGSGGTEVGTVGVSGDGSYSPPAAFTPARAGTYWWFASYSGDASDRQVASPCGADMPNTVVTAPAMTVSAPRSGQPSATTTESTAGATPKPNPPTLSAVRLTSRRFTAKRGTKLKLRLSQMATVKVRITQQVKGHRAGKACRRGAGPGRRCTVTVAKRSMSFNGREGADTFALKLAKMPDGKYAVAVVADNAHGQSKTFERPFTMVPVLDRRSK